MNQFLAELKRRHIYRVAAAYAVLAWLLIQVVNNVAPVLDLPPWVARAFLLALLIGFPVTMFFAWMRELPSSDAAAPHAATTKLDYGLAGALVLVIGLVSYQQLSSSSSTLTAQQASIAPTPSQPQSSGISIAVLPFANLSGDASQEFFSDGMTEEITSTLAKVQGLTVIGRTSAFEFKGQNRDLRMIGQALGTTHLIEGSVRKAGNRVRISAQLIRADSGANLWTETFDRELIDVFAIQDDIAQAIVTALRVPLGLQQGERLVSDRTDDIEFYDQYLRARANYRARAARGGGSTGYEEAITILEALTARNSSYAPAWALLANAYLRSPGDNVESYGISIEEARRIVLLSQAKAESAARRAIQTDARYAGGYAALGRVQDSRGKWVEAEDLYRQALVLDPNAPEVLQNYSSMLFNVGRFEDSLNVRMRLQTLEPLDLGYKRDAAFILFIQGQPRAGIPIIEALPLEMRGVTLARMYASLGRFADAADTLLAMPGLAVGTRRSVEDAAKLLRAAPGQGEAPLPQLEGGLNFVYAYVGTPNRMLDNSERTLQIGRFTSVVLWGPEIASLRRSERYKALVRSVGLVDYWRERGWPNFCSPVADDFECD